MFFNKQKSREVTLIVDIGSGSVGAALVSLSKGALPKILFSTRVPVALQSESERSQSVARVVRVLELVMNTVAGERLVVHRSHIIFSSPWYVSETKIIKIEHDSPTLVTHHTIDRLTKEAEQKFVESSGSVGEIVERRVIRTKLNGYDTPNPYNKKAKSLEVTFYTSIVAKDILESVRQVIGKHFHIRNNEISSFSLTAWGAISSILPDEQDFLVVDVRDDVTDLSLISDGTLIKSISFPKSKNTLVRAVARGSRHSPTAALSLLSMALSGESKPATRTEIMKYTETFKQNWLQAFKGAVQEIGSAKLSASQTIFLMVDPDVEAFFENTLNEDKKDSNLLSLQFLNPQKYIDPSSSQTDSFLALESIFVTMI